MGVMSREAQEQPDDPALQMTADEGAADAHRSSSDDVFNFTHHFSGKVPGFQLSAEVMNEHPAVKIWCHETFQFLDYFLSEGAVMARQINDQVRMRVGDPGIGQF